MSRQLSPQPAIAPPEGGCLRNIAPHQCDICLLKTEGRDPAAGSPLAPPGGWVGALGTECETDVVLGGIQGLHEGIYDAFRRTDKALSFPSLHAGG